MQVGWMDCPAARASDVLFAAEVPDIRMHYYLQGGE